MKTSGGNIPEPIKQLVRLLAEIAVKEYLEEQKKSLENPGEKQVQKQKKRA